MTLETIVELEYWGWIIVATLMIAWGAWMQPKDRP